MSAVEVERLRADVRAAYAERDQQFERKVEALRERDEARRTHVARMIREFHAAMGDEPHCLGFPTREVEALRFRLLYEEVEELRDASEASDIIAVADALADIVYVAYGTAYAHGIDLDAVLTEVHRSNMSKDFSGPAGDRKAQKGAGYRPPDIAGVLGVEASHV